jgi:CheY-like chemotaxis protein
MRIVLIDDQDRARVRLSKMLEQEAHDVASANCGRRGLRKLRQGRPDVLITEVLMPTMDGLEIIKAARQMYPDLRIVAISGGGRFVSADLALTLARAFGADRILYRPFPKKDLLDAIKRR